MNTRPGEKMPNEEVLLQITARRYGDSWDADGGMSPHHLPDGGIDAAIECLEQLRDSR